MSLLNIVFNILRAFLKSKKDMVCERLPGVQDLATVVLVG